MGGYNRFLMCLQIVVFFTHKLARSQGRKNGWTQCVAKRSIFLKIDATKPPQEISLPCIKIMNFSNSKSDKEFTRTVNRELIEVREKSAESSPFSGYCRYICGFNRGVVLIVFQSSGLRSD